MIAIITGDIIKSRTAKPTSWLPVLEEAITCFSKKFDIFRGDSFQLEVSVDKVLVAAFYIKAAMIEIGLDARMGIGIGLKDDNKGSLKTTFGSALIYSGESFEELKKETLHLRTSDERLNALCNTILPLLTELTLRWTSNIAETVKVAFLNEGSNQSDLAKLLNKKHQSQVSTALQKGAYAKIQHALAFCTAELLKL
ncbi:hypothetical protein [Sphingobacterium deserti]|uniref:Uncharacterized protein n=1 Tax=Sphingobacterium deserti TaxID=1229276 RepID=A0A0B8SZB8_9SPHI|nr:hypothetical protein [Sphingobacterium deserti]KGE12776.1 hypothetical protein DI53_3515 [Sphingobacterium deserti]